MHGKHCDCWNSWVTLLKVPVGQGDGWALDCGQYPPVGQLSGVVMPAVGQYMPAGHGVHEDCPGLGLYVPGKHCTENDEPDTQVLPAGQMYPVTLSVGYGDTAPDTHA